MLTLSVNAKWLELEVNRNVRLENARGGFFVHNSRTNHTIELDSTEADVYRFISEVISDSDKVLTIDEIINCQCTHYNMHEKEVPVIRSNVKNALLKFYNEKILVHRN